MSVRARSLFLVFLALVAGQLAMPAQTTTASTGEAAAPVFEPVQVHHEPHPASYGARSWLPDRRADRQADRHTDALFAPSQATRDAPSARHVHIAGPPRVGSPADALLLLPPSRAPPALS